MGLRNKSKLMNGKCMPPPHPSPLCSAAAMAWVVLCKEDGLWAMLPERSGGDTYGLRRLDAARANSAEALAAVAAVASGSACVVDLQRYEAAVSCLSHDELVQVRFDWGCLAAALCMLTAHQRNIAHTFRPGAPAPGCHRCSAAGQRRPLPARPAASAAAMWRGGRRRADPAGGSAD